MKKQPEQTAYTRQRLIDTFWVIAQEQGLSNVTISALTKRAGYNRGTFYVYFNSLEHLLQQDEDKILHEFLTQMSAVLSNGIPDDLESASIKVIETLCRYDDKLFLLLGKNGDPCFSIKLREKASELIPFVCQGEHFHPYHDFIVTYVTAAFTGLLTYWHENGRKISIEEIAMISRTMVTKGLVGLLSDAPGDKILPHQKR